MALTTNQEFKEEIKIVIDHIVEEEEEEEEEELFEIDLELVNNISPPHYNLESYFTTATSSCTLLANCLLPIADVSSAIPTTTKACDNFISWPPGGSSFSCISMVNTQQSSQVKDCDMCGGDHLNHECQATNQNDEQPSNYPRNPLSNYEEVVPIFSPGPLARSTALHSEDYVNVQIPRTENAPNLTPPSPPPPTMAAPVVYEINNNIFTEFQDFSDLFEGYVPLFQPNERHQKAVGGCWRKHIM
ncbi:hypothetical protein RND71_035963 [Anisodus tanguticus]|uniref:Uncharacterized protein n=1 Tax=Anisodus tanguticus TaxID=243964 RepID=A0AAE1UWB3_9SOLA|nr:hypothetical protein RND71_035963 [Anisodus tanguticus]